MRKNSSVAGMFAAMTLAASVAVPAVAQTLTPLDDAQKARFEAVSRAAASAGYQAPEVVGFEEGDRLLALLATRESEGRLVIAPSGGEPGPFSPIDVEKAGTSADLGVQGVRFERFLGRADLVDVVVSHRPFRLEMSYQFDRHHLLRRGPSGLSLVCQFDGGSSSSHAKGPRSVSDRRTVTVEGSGAERSGSLRFLVRTVSERTEKSSVGPSEPSTERSTTTTTYELPTTGPCVATAGGPTSQ